MRAHVDCYPFSGPPIPYTPNMFPRELRLLLRTIRILFEITVNPKFRNSPVAAEFADGVPILSS